MCWQGVLIFRWCYKRSNKPGPVGLWFYNAVFTFVMILKVIKEKWGTKTFRFERNMFKLVNSALLHRKRKVVGWSNLSHSGWCWLWMVTKKCVFFKGMGLCYSLWQSRWRTGWSLAIEFKMQLVHFLLVACGVWRLEAKVNADPE